MSDETGRFMVAVEEDCGFTISLGQQPTTFTIRPGRGPSINNDGETDPELNVLLNGELFCTINDGIVCIDPAYRHPAIVSTDGAMELPDRELTIYAAAYTRVEANEGATVHAKPGAVIQVDVPDPEFPGGEGDCTATYTVTDTGQFEERGTL